MSEQKTVSFQVTINISDNDKSLKAIVALAQSLKLPVEVNRIETFQIVTKVPFDTPQVKAPTLGPYVSIVVAAKKLVKFTIQDLARESGASQPYVWQCVDAWKDHAHVLPAGARQGARGRSTVVWELTDPERFNPPKVSFARKKKSGRR